MPLPALAVPIAIGAGKAISSFFKGRGADSKAKAGARNQNKMNKYKHKFGKANWDTEKKSYYRGRDRSRSLRNQIMAGLMKNPAYGLDKLFPGFANFSKEWVGQGKGMDQTPQQYTQNTFDVAGPPPELEAATAGTFNNAAGALGAGVAAGGSAYMQGKPA
jgi:hypothetical protein